MEFSRAGSSLIEAWWRSLKHQSLFLHQLDSIATVRRLGGFYVQQHNEVMPHSTFSGFTPNELYFGKTDGLLPALAETAGVRQTGTTRSQLGGLVPNLSAGTSRGRATSAA